MIEIAGGIVLAILFLAMLPLLSYLAIFALYTAPVVALLAGMLGAYGPDGAAACWMVATLIVATFLFIAWVRTTQQKREESSKYFNHTAYNLGRAIRRFNNNRLGATTWRRS